MSDILCRWLNSELRLSKVIEQSTISRDFSNGYLIGEVLHKFELQNDFELFSKSSSSNAKLNNFTRIEPTLHLLGVPFDLAMAKAMMQAQPGAASRLLYQLYILLQKKKKAGLTGTEMETMQPAATARLHRVENSIYTDRLKTVVKRGAELKMQMITERYEMKAQKMYNKSVLADLVKDQKRLQEQELMRLEDIEKHRLARKKQQELMSRILTAGLQIPKPPPNRTLKALHRQRQQKQHLEAKNVQLEIAQFEKIRKKLSPPPPDLSGMEGSYDMSTAAGQVLHHTLSPEEMTKANAQYIQRIRQRLEEDAAAREQREKRRRRVLVEQLRAHEAQEEALREGQLVERLMRQSQHEKRLAVQLMQVRQQKEVLRQNRIQHERQFQEQRLRDFQEALDREAVLAQQAKVERAEEARREMELHDRLVAEWAQARYRKHYNFCREVLEQVVDLATRCGEYRLYTANLVPGKMMREWKELFYSGKPLYELACVDPVPEEPTPEQLLELEKEELLNDQDFEDYVSMSGEWAWKEDGQHKSPPTNNDILGHVVYRLQNIVNPPKPGTPPPLFPRFTLRACVLGKVLSGKTMCLTKIAQDHGIHVLSPTVLIQQALAAYKAGHTEEEKEIETVESTDSIDMNGDVPEKESVKEVLALSDSDENAKPEGASQKDLVTSQMSMRAQHGAAVQRILRKGKAVPNPLLVDIIVDAIREVPAGCGWILDGFPMNVEQAKLLEMALSGSDPNKKPGKVRRTSLAVDMKNASQEAPQRPKVLDLALLMEVADDVVLSRAAQQDTTVEGLPAQETEQSQALEGDESTEAQEQQVTSSSDSTLNQLQHCLTGFQDSWPKLEKWLSAKDKNILVRLNAQEDTETVFKQLEQILHETMTAKEKAETPTLVQLTTSAPILVAVSASDTTTSASPSALAQEAASNKRSRSKSTGQSPRTSYSYLEGVKKSTLEVKDSRRQLSGNALAAGRRHSILSSTEMSLGENGTRPTSPAAVPGSADWVYVDEPVPKDVSDYLVPYWDNVCDAYVLNVKSVMQNLRRERNLIIHHLHNIRDEFKLYLRRPDLKQEFVNQWQQDHNGITEDMREDEETKAELHQRLDDLRERLWDICDRRKEEAEQERAALTEDGWLEDHTSLLNNHFCSLMQVEIDRFQDSMRVLRDYYYSMGGSGLPVGPDFTVIPLLDIVEEEEEVVEVTDKSPRSPPSDKTSRSVTDEPEEKKAEEKKTKIVPLIPRRPATADSTKQKGTSQVDEKMLNDIYQAAITAINNLMQAEIHQQELEESKDQRAVERERQLRMSQASAAANSAKDKKKGGAKKKPPSPVQEPSPPPAADAPDAQKLAIRAKIRQEYMAALQHEESAVKQRVELVRQQAVETVKSLQSRADLTYRRLEEWLSARFIAEMASIDQLAEVARHHIESASKIQHELVLSCNDFYLDGDLRVLASPSPPPRPPPREKATDSTLTILQLQDFYNQMLKVAPSGIVTSSEFLDILKEMTSMNVGDSDLPDAWMNISEAQMLEMANVLAQDSEVLDWRLFLLSAALPWPLASKQQLLQLLTSYQAADPQATGYITQEQYMQTELWFGTEDSEAVPEDPSEPLPYNRLANLKKFFFTLFAVPGSCPARLDYVRMLLGLAAHRDPVQGFIRALGLLTGQPLHCQRNLSPLIKSVLYLGEETEEVVKAEEEEEEEEKEAASPVEPDGGGGGGDGVSLSALLDTLCPQHHSTAASHDRLYPSQRSRDEYKEELLQVYKDLGLGAEERAPFSRLAQHPWMQNVMESLPLYHLPDIHRIL